MTSDLRLWTPEAKSNINPNASVGAPNPGTNATHTKFLDLDSKPLTEIKTSNLVSRRQPKRGDRIVASHKLECELGLSSGFTENYSSRSP